MLHGLSICTICNSDPRVDLQALDADIILMNNLRCHSFAILKNHALPINLLNGIYLEWKHFFSRSDKYDWLRDEYLDEGYVPVNTETAQNSNYPDYKEFYETHYKGKLPENITLESTLKLMDQFVDLTARIIKLLDQQLPVSVKEKMNMSLLEMISGNHNHMLRVIHYPPMSKSHEAERAASHGDACLFTILPVATSRGLEFLNQNGNWFEPQLDQTDVVLFNSDMIELCTDGYFKSAMHRVTQIENESLASRFSIPFFIHPKRNVLLRENMNAYDFMKIRLTEIGYDGSKLVNTEL